MTADNRCGMIQVTDGWARCPICKTNKRLLRIAEETTARNLPVYCRICKNEIILDIAGQSDVRQSQ